MAVPGDQEHEVAVEITGSLKQEDLVTTNQVRGETWTLLLSRSNHSVAVGFLDLLEHSKTIRVETIDPSLEDRALQWLRRHDERAYSFVDATSFVFMEANGITEALAFDGDFAAAGFTELRP